MLTTHLHLAPRLIKQRYTSTPLYAFEMWTGRILHFIFILSVLRFVFFFTFVILLCEIIYCSYMQRNCLIVNSDLLQYDVVPLAQAMQKKKKLLGP